MSGMVANAEDVLDQGRHSLPRPNLSDEAVVFGSLGEEFGRRASCSWRSRGVRPGAG